MDEIIAEWKNCMNVGNLKVYSKSIPDGRETNRVKRARLDQSGNVRHAQLTYKVESYQNVDIFFKNCIQFFGVFIKKILKTFFSQIFFLN